MTDMANERERPDHSRLIAQALRNDPAVLSLTEDEPELTKNALTVLDRRYLAKDREGNVVEGPDSMFRRVARDLSLADLEYGASEEERLATEEKFYRAMRRLEVMPNSPTLMNAGRELQQLSACFVLPVEDSLDSIFDQVKRTALIHKSGGGTGFSFTRLRPAGDVVGSTGGVASGPVSFIRAFDTATDVVKQGGTRRGANMGILNVDHPDIMAFIESKRDGKNLSNFNISVAVTDEFMQKLKTCERYDLVNPRTREKTGTLDAREVFGRIAEMAWETGDPGLVFLDRINRDNPNPKLGRIESTNPCVTGDTVVMTSEGPFRAEELVGKPFEAMVDGVSHPSGPEGFFSTGTREVVRITGSNLPGDTSGKPELTLTPDHLVIKIGDKTTNWTTSWTTAGEIKTGDQIRRHDHRKTENGQAEVEPAVTTVLVNSNKVTNVEPAGRQEVFDVHVPGINAFDANGFYVHNCGEQALMPYESCNLASVNLTRMVRYPGDGPVEIDWDRLDRVVKTTVHMLDNVIDRNKYPIPEIGEMSRATRRIGLGVMGFSDLLVQLGIPYDSEEGVQIAREVMKRVHDRTHEASAELATYRGVYPAWEESIYDPPAESGEEPEAAQAAQPVQMRNSAPTTIAPTGTISIIAGASSGIEPLFALSYVRNVMDNTRLIEGNPHFEAAARHEGIYSEELMEELAKSGSLSGLEPKFGVTEWMKQVFRTSHDISPEWHVRMQAAFQEHTDNSVSKTINFPQSALVEDVAWAYRLAYDLGCKGITVYRDGSKEGQVLSTGGEQSKAEPETFHRTRERPAVMRGVTERVRSGHGNMYVTVNLDMEGRPFEVFANQGKAGGCDSAQIEGVSRLATLALRSGVDPEVIVEQLRGITCCPAWDGGIQIKSAPDALALVLARCLEGQAPRYEAASEGIQPRLLDFERTAGVKCPDCGSEVTYQEGCLRCTAPDCGWSRCE